MRRTALILTVALCMVVGLTASWGLIAPAYAGPVVWDEVWTFADDLGPEWGMRTSSLSEGPLDVLAGDGRLVINDAYANTRDARVWLNRSFADFVAEFDIQLGDFLGGSGYFFLQFRKPTPDDVPWRSGGGYSLQIQPNGALRFGVPGTELVRTEIEGFSEEMQMTIKIVAKGANIQLLVNDIEYVNIQDQSSPSGAVSFMVNDMKATIGAIRFRALEAQVPPSATKPRQIILTFQDDPRTSITVTWRTDIEPSQGATVHYAMDASKSLAEFQSQAAESFTFVQSRAWINTARLSGLTPGTEYTVVIESDGNFSEPFLFATAPAESREIVIAAGGDSRTNREARRSINALAAQDAPDFVIFAGDMIQDPLSEPQWDDWFDDWDDLMITASGRRIPVVPAIGNHEVVGGFNGTMDDAPYYYNRFMVPDPKAYYVLTYGPDLTIITLDSGHSVPILGEQLQWLEATLQAYQDSKWIIVQYHVAAYPSVRSMTGEGRELIREYWVPLFDRYGVDLVIESHDHAYKRTEPLTGGEVDRENGIVYIGDGGWGAPLRNTRNPDNYPWLAEAASAFHYFRLTLSADGSFLRVEPIFLDHQPLELPPDELRSAQERRSRLYAIVEEAVAKARADYNPRERFVLFTDPTFALLTRGDWRDGDFADIDEAIFAQSYLLALNTLHMPGQTSVSVEDVIIRFRDTRLAREYGSFELPMGLPFYLTKPYIGSRAICNDYERSS